MTLVLIKSDTFHRADSLTVGNGWVDAASAWKIDGNTLKPTVPGTAQWTSGSGELLRPTSENFRNGKVRIYPAASYAFGLPFCDLTAILRYQDSGHYYAAYIIGNLWLCITKTNGGANGAIATSSSIALPEGGAWYAEFEANESTLTMTAFSLDGTVLTTTTVDDTDINAAGQWGAFPFNETPFTRIDGYSGDGGDPPPPTTITPVDGAIGFIGDSITAGYDPDTGLGTNAAPLAMIAKLNSDKTSGFSYTAFNQGINSTTSADWNGVGGHLSGAITAFIASGCGTINVMLGTNDAGGGSFSKETYKSNMQLMITALLAVGVTRILLHKPAYYTIFPDSRSLIPGYADAIVELAGADPTHVFVGDTQAWIYFQTHPEEFADTVHPNAAGYASLGRLWAKAYESAFPTGWKAPEDPNQAVGVVELVSCQTETRVCTLCGRGPLQNNYCRMAPQAAGSLSYKQNATEERPGGPHIL